MSTEPTTQELENIGLCAQKLWDLDADKLKPEVDYGLNPQGGTRRGWDDDRASERLFLGVRPAVWDKPAYRSFYVLLDNYHKTEGITEDMTEQERTESRNFIDEIMKSAPMQYVKNYLVAKDLASEDEDAFKRMLFSLWFDFYRRERRDDSSGFEHVFCGEVDDDVGGFHNWVQFFIEEALGRVNYRGYIYPRSRAPVPDENERIMQIQFEWEGKVKRITSIFVGSSPAFEVALYTLYFLAGQRFNRAEILNYTVDIVCYTIHGNRIGTAYPKIISED